MTGNSPMSEPLFEIEIIALALPPSNYASITANPMRRSYLPREPQTPNRHRPSSSALCRGNILELAITRLGLINVGAVLLTLHADICTAVSPLSSVGNLLVYTGGRIPILPLDARLDTEKSAKLGKSLLERGARLVGCQHLVTWRARKAQNAGAVPALAAPAHARDKQVWRLNGRLEKLAKR